MICWSLSGAVMFGVVIYTDKVCKRGQGVYLKYILGS
jgi:hypothetical protein